MNLGKVGGVLGESWKHLGKSGEVLKKSHFRGNSWKILVKGRKMLGAHKDTLWDPIRGWDTSGHSNAGGVNL